MAKIPSLVRRDRRGQDSPNEGNQKRAKKLKAETDATGDTMPLQIFELVVDFLPCYNLPKIASVSEGWRNIVAKSYKRRINRPWVLPVDLEERQHARIAEGDVRAGFERLRSEEFALRDGRGVEIDAKLTELDGGNLRFQVAPTEGSVFRESKVVPFNVAPILPLLPLERDLPIPLQHGSTVLKGCSLVDGKLLLLVSRTWSPSYHTKLVAAGIVDNYQEYVERFPRLLENPEGFNRREFWSNELQGEDVGADLWAILYHVKAADGSDNASTPKLLDAQRLTRCDYTYFSMGVEQSKNGSVACVVVGMRDGRHDGADGCNCIPTIVTVKLDKETGITLQPPLEWPTPCDLADTYTYALTLTPSGDYLMGNYGDMANCKGLCFYKLSDETGGVSGWQPVWKEEEDDGWDSLEGFFTADGDFVVTQSYDGVDEGLPGPTAMNVYDME